MLAADDEQADLTLEDGLDVEVSILGGFGQLDQAQLGGAELGQVVHGGPQRLASRGELAAPGAVGGREPVLDVGVGCWQACEACVVGEELGPASCWSFRWRPTGQGEPALVFVRAAGLGRELYDVPAFSDRPQTVSRGNGRLSTDFQRFFLRP
jgi:hypothetical protein